MKLVTLALASAFALSSTFAVAYTNPNHHRSGVRTHHGAVGMSYAPTYRGRMNYGGCGDNGGIWTVGVGTAVRMGSVRTTDPGWLAATTPVPSPKRRRRVSARLLGILQSK